MCRECELAFSNWLQVPPIINAMSRNASLLSRFDLSTVRSVIAGGGPLQKEDYARMHAIRPDWKLLSGWGKTTRISVQT